MICYLFYSMNYVWNFKDLHHQVGNIGILENLSLWQKLQSVPYQIRLSPIFNAKINPKYLKNLSFFARNFLCYFSKWFILIKFSDQSRKSQFRLVDGLIWYIIYYMTIPLILVFTRVKGCYNCSHAIFCYKLDLHSSQRSL